MTPAVIFATRLHDCAVANEVAGDPLPDDVIEVLAIGLQMIAALTGADADQAMTEASENVKAAIHAKQVMRRMRMAR